MTEAGVVTSPTLSLAHFAAELVTSALLIIWPELIISGVNPISGDMSFTDTDWR
jgi:hypothetical protein